MQKKVMNNLQNGNYAEFILYDEEEQEKLGKICEYVIYPKLHRPTQEELEDLFNQDKEDI